MKFMLLACLMILVALPVFAQCPHEIGVFSTYDDTMLPGRSSEAWCEGNAWAAGNILNTQSWDGSNVGAQWQVFDMAIDPEGAVLVQSNIDENGNGWEEYSINYEGGEFWFSKDHSWGDGITDLHGTVDSYLIYATASYVGGNLTGVIANISWYGSFLDCPELNACVVEFSIANSMLVWRSDSGLPEPENYPGMMCGAEGLGEVHDQCCITMSLNCAVESEDSSWSSLKAMYR